MKAIVTKIGNSQTKYGTECHLELELRNQEGKYTILAGYATIHVTPHYGGETFVMPTVGQEVDIVVTPQVAEVVPFGLAENLQEQKNG